MHRQMETRTNTSCLTRSERRTGKWSSPSGFCQPGISLAASNIKRCDLRAEQCPIMRLKRRNTLPLWSIYATTLSSPPFQRVECWEISWTWWCSLAVRWRHRFTSTSQVGRLKRGYHGMNSTAISSGDYNILSLRWVEVLRCTSLRGLESFEKEDSLGARELFVRFI